MTGERELDAVFLVFERKKHQLYCPSLSCPLIFNPLVSFQLCRFRDLAACFHQIEGDVEAVIQGRL